MLRPAPFNFFYLPFIFPLIFSFIALLTLPPLPHHFLPLVANFEPSVTLHLAAVKSRGGGFPFWNVCAHLGVSRDDTRSRDMARRYKRYKVFRAVYWVFRCRFFDGFCSFTLFTSF
jgi:hypothetical protein